MRTPQVHYCPSHHRLAQARGSMVALITGDERQPGNVTVQCRAYQWARHLWTMLPRGSFSGLAPANAGLRRSHPTLSPRTDVGCLLRRGRRQGQLGGVFQIMEAWKDCSGCRRCAGTEGEGTSWTALKLRRASISGPTQRHDDSAAATTHSARPAIGMRTIDASVAPHPAEDAHCTKVRVGRLSCCRLPLGATDDGDADNLSC